MLSILFSVLGNRWVGGSMAVAAVLLAVWSAAFYRGKGSVDVVSIERSAFAKGQTSRDAEWETKLAAVQRDSEARIAEAIAERDAVADVAPSDDLVELCKRSASCRDKGRGAKR